ncbi:MAG: beta-lactamase family protein [Clostridia bacterium]|nr:beta-lactamase family protein [Clostridia bacterium]
MKKEDIAAYVREKEPNICQICVWKNGKEVFSGEWNGYKKTDCVHIASAAKSIVSILVGIAVDKGMIKSVDEKVLSYFPDYAVKRGEKTIYDVTVKHLLTMRAPYKGKGDPWTKVCTSANWTNASLDFLGGRKGITDEFDYRTVCLHTLTGILHRATGMKTADFANKYLFTPLGIAEHKNFYAKNADEHIQFTVEKVPKENVWFADPDGLATPGYGLCMSAADMVKIGQLCLNKGMFNGKRIVCEEWISEMTNPREVEGNRFRGMQYGYLWWIIHPENGIYAAIGDSGNVIYVNPVRNISVAITSCFKPAVSDRIDFIENILLPCLGEKND